MRIYVVRRQLVQVQQGLVDILLQLQGALHGLQPTSPLVTLWFLQRRNIQLQQTEHSLSLVYTEHKSYESPVVLLFLPFITLCVITSSEDQLWYLITEEKRFNSGMI